MHLARKGESNVDSPRVETMATEKHQTFLRLLAKIAQARGSVPLTELAAHYRLGSHLLASLSSHRPPQGQDIVEVGPTTPPDPAVQSGVPSLRPRSPVPVAGQPRAAIAPPPKIPNDAPKPLIAEVRPPSVLPDYWQRLMVMEFGEFDRFCEHMGHLALAIAMKSVKVEEVSTVIAPLGLKPARRLLELISQTRVSWPPQARRSMRSVFSHLLNTRKPDDVLRGVGISILTTLYNVMDASLRPKVSSPRIRAVLDAHPMSACTLPEWPRLADQLVQSALRSFK